MSYKKFTIEGDLNTGFEKIDAQHRELFDRLNSLLDAAYHVKSVKEVQRFVMFLAEYMKEHLDLEEKLLSENGYSAFDAHKREHKKFKEAYGGIIDRFNGGEIDHRALVEELEIHVGEWFSNHIRTTDRAAMNFLLEKGIS